LNPARLPIPPHPHRSRPLCYGAVMKGKLAFLDRWYESTKALARHPRATPLLCFISFIESVFFPIPTAIMFAPMVQADHSKAWRLATICAIFSVVGLQLCFLPLWSLYIFFISNCIKSPSITQ